jgi:hypothetical protein
MLSQEDVLDMAGYLFSLIEDPAERNGIVRLATELLLPELTESKSEDRSERAMHLVRIAIEAHQG